MAHPIAVGPIVGVESDTAYTICFLLDEAGEPPRVVVDGVATPARRLATTAGGEFWRCVHVGSLGVITDTRDPLRTRAIHQVVSSGIVHPAPTWMEWKGIQAGSTDRPQILKPEVTAQNVTPVGGDRFIRSRNFAVLQEGTDDKLWVEWVCEDGARREYGITRA